MDQRIYDPLLTNSDIAQIQRSVNKLPNIDHHILNARCDGDHMVHVETGTDPARGHFVLLEREIDRWAVRYVGGWVA